MSMVKEPVPWSKQRFVWVIFLLATLQVALVWHLSHPADTVIASPRTASVIRLVPSSADPASEWFYLNDPALFALISPKGFSGSAWLRLRRFPYQLTNTIEPADSLEASANQFASDLDHFLPPEGQMHFLAIVKPAPPWPELPISNRPRVVRPALRIQGALAARPLISTNALPEGDPEKASRCEVKIVVNAAGDVISSVLWSSCGSPVADRQAVAFAQNARFASIDADPAAVTLGFLVFHWIAGTLEARSSTVSQ